MEWVCPLACNALGYISGKSYDYTRCKFPFNHHNYSAFSFLAAKAREGDTLNIVQLFRQHLNFILCSLRWLSAFSCHMFGGAYTMRMHHTRHAHPSESIKWTIFARIWICRRFTSHTRSHTHNYILIMFSFRFYPAFPSSFSSLFSLPLSISVSRFSLSKYTPEPNHFLYVFISSFVVMCFSFCHTHSFPLGLRLRKTKIM